MTKWLDRLLLSFRFCWDITSGKSFMKTPGNVGVAAFASLSLQDILIREAIGASLLNTISKWSFLFVTSYWFMKTVINACPIFISVENKHYAYNCFFFLTGINLALKVKFQWILATLLLHVLLGEKA